MNEYELGELNTHRIKKGAITNIATEFNKFNDTNNTIAATKLVAREYLNINRAKAERTISDGKTNQVNDGRIPTGAEIKDAFEAGEYREISER